MKGWQGAVAVLGGLVLGGVMFGDHVDEPPTKYISASTVTDRVAGSCRVLDDTYVCVPTVAPKFGGTVADIGEDGSAVYSRGKRFDPESHTFNED